MPRFSQTLALLAALFAAPIPSTAQPAHVPQPTAYAHEYVRVFATPADASGYRDRLEQARAALLAKRWSDAETLLQQLVAYYPLDRETWRVMPPSTMRASDFSTAKINTPSL